MKKFSIIIMLIIVYISMIQNSLEESEGVEKKLQMELVVTDEQKTILFGSFVLAIIILFAYLARDIIFRKKTAYDSNQFDSKTDKTYEKYHSDWSDDYEEFGTRKNLEEKEFEITSQNPSLPNYYEILEISQNATHEEIKKQYRQLAKKIHPDKNKDKKSEEIMTQINKAYEILSNKELRKKYDMCVDRD